MIKQNFGCGYKKIPKLPPLRWPWTLVVDQNRQLCKMCGWLAGILSISIVYQCPGSQPPLRKGGSFWMMINPYLKKWWIKQPIKNGGQGLLWIDRFGTEQEKDERRKTTSCQTSRTVQKLGCSTILSQWWLVVWDPVVWDSKGTPKVIIPFIRGSWESKPPTLNHQLTITLSPIIMEVKDGFSPIGSLPFKCSHFPLPWLWGGRVVEICSFKRGLQVKLKKIRVCQYDSSASRQKDSRK